MTLYLSEKECEEKMLQGIRSINGLKARVQTKKANGTAITITTKENAIKKNFVKRFLMPLDFDFFLNILWIPMNLKKI